MKLTERDKNRILFRLLAKLTNTTFTTPYFQALAGQEIENIDKIAVTQKQFNNICSLKNQEKKNVLYILRDKNGKLKNTCYVNKKGELFIK